MWIFLDDKRKDATIVHNKNRGLGVGIGRANNWVIARDYFQFIDILKSNFDQIDFISFDHDISSYDMDEKEMTGKDAAQFLIDYCMDNGKTIPDWFVHSDNTGGNRNIRQLLINYMYRVEGRLDKMVDAYGYINGKLFFNI
jgi:hypothetical protein